MAAEFPLIAREHELAVAIGALDAAVAGRGAGVLITGEAGIGKTRLLREVRLAAEQRGVPVLYGRAVEAGGAYRALVEAFTRTALPLAQDAELDGIRPILARVLPGWVSREPVLATMADPAAVLAEALIVLLDRRAPGGAVLLLDDLQWADADTISVLGSLADALDALPLALVLAVRAEQPAQSAVDELGRHPSIRTIALARLRAADVRQALAELPASGLEDAQLDRIVAVADGLPIVLDELARQIVETGSASHELDLRNSALAAAVRQRLQRLPSESRAVVDALAVIGDAEPDVLSAGTGLSLVQLGPALRGGLASTLLVSASTTLGVRWRHQLIREAVRDLLVPLEQQAISLSAADRLSARAAPTEAELQQAARLYRLAGRDHQASGQLVRAARLAVRHAALDAAQQCLSEARALTGDLDAAARDVLVEQIETLVVAGRAGDAYERGIEAVRQLGASDDRELVVATTRAAYAAGHYGRATELLAEIERDSSSVDGPLVLLRAQAALADRRADAVGLAQQAADQAEREGRTDLSCEAMVVAGIAARRLDIVEAERLLVEAADRSRRSRQRVWEVRAWAEAGVLDLMTDSVATRLEQARDLAATAGMVGAVAEIDMRIGEAVVVRRGFVASYPIFLRAYMSARRLRLSSLQARTYSHLTECALMAGLPLPGTARQATVSERESVAADVRRMAEQARIPAAYTLGVLSWAQGDSRTAIRVIDQVLELVADEVKIMPWWGFCRLLRVIDGCAPSDAFGAGELIGHHTNWAARALAVALWEARAGRPSDGAIAEAEQLLRHTPFWRQVLLTVVAPAAFDSGIIAAEGWLREADAYFDAAEEPVLQRRARHLLGTIGAKLPRRARAVSPSLARLGITGREVEVLRLLDEGLSNADIAARLFISVRTVETHVSSLFRKCGVASREELPGVLAGADPPAV